MKKIKKTINEALQYHSSTNTPLTENIFRAGSLSYFETFCYARKLLQEGKITLNKRDRDVLQNTDIGKWGVYENKWVPLDFPMLAEQDQTDVYSPSKTIPSQMDGKPTRNSVEFSPKTSKITEDDVEKYHDDLNKKIKHGDAAAHSRVAMAKAKDPNAFKWTKGTHVYSPKTGKTYEIVGNYVTKKGELRYMYTSADEQGQFIVDKAHQFLIPLTEAEYQGRKVELNKPKRNTGDGKKYMVYVKDPKTGNVRKITFGDLKGGLTAKTNDPEARKRFAARHDCENKNDKTKPGYWACRLPRYAKSLGISASGKWW